jgi:GrpB-like predicted nucleotidyltransferase (UPF0157 family)
MRQTINFIVTILTFSFAILHLSMDLKDKYIFRPYNPIYLELFKKEKERIQKVLETSVQIEHIGSTAVPGLGGKGVIDISVSTPKENWSEISSKLESLGYAYKKKEEEREKEKLFFMITLPDEELGTRIYHVHLTYPESIELKRSLGFRDFLRTHPKEREEYAEIKKGAAEAIKNLSTKDEMRDLYDKMKKNFIEKIIRLLQL